MNEVSGQPGRSTSRHSTLTDCIFSMSTLSTSNHIVVLGHIKKVTASRAKVERAYAVGHAETLLGSETRAGVGL